MEGRKSLGEKILVVEDDGPINQAIRYHLEKEGYEVLSASDGVEALKLIHVGRLPDLIIADIIMPQMDGYELCRQVRSRPECSSIPFIFLSCKVEREDRLRGRELGADDYLTKPFDAKELLLTVRNRLERGRDIERRIAALRQELMEAVSDELRAKIKNLETLVQQKEQMAVIGEMAARLVHDLKNPLTAILGRTQILYNSLEGDERNGRHCQAIMEAVESMNRRIRAILHFIREVPLQLAWVNLNDLIHDTLSSLEKELQEKEVQVHLNLNTDLPLLLANEELLNDSLFNLFHNAVQAMEKVEVRELRILTDCADDQIIVQVMDTGEGIPEENVNRIFYPFFSTRGGGTGLGLANVKKSVEAHGGTVTVKSEVGEGTSFVLQLPIRVTEVVPRQMVQMA